MRWLVLLTCLVVASPAPALAGGAAASATVTVDFAHTIRTVDARTFAINTAVWDGTFTANTTAAAVEPLQLALFRFPGGSISDTYHWKSNMSDGQNFRWASDFDAFMRTIDTLGSSAMITVNYGSGTAQEAADWVRYANVTKGYGVVHWEVGNENYGSWENDVHDRKNDPFTYANTAAEYISAMKAVDPTIKIGLVVLPGEDSSFVEYHDHPARNPRTGLSHVGWTPVMLATLKSLGVTPDYVVYHYYAQNPPGESDAFLLSSASSWASAAADLRRQLDDYLGDAGAGVEILATENNSVSFNPGKQTTSLVNGLYLADSVGQILQTEINAMVWWDLSNGQESNHNNSKTLFGWRKYGDYGILSPDHSQRYPTYYAMELLTAFARGGERVVKVTTSDPLLAAYAVETVDGGAAILVINKSRNRAYDARFDLGGFVPAASARAWSYGKAQDKAAKTGRGSTEIEKTTFDVTGGALRYKFPAYSMTVLVIQKAAS